MTIKFENTSNIVRGSSIIKKKRDFRSYWRSIGKNVQRGKLFRIK